MLEHDQRLYLLGLTPSDAQLLGVAIGEIDQGLAIERFPLTGVDAIGVRIPAGIFDGPDAEERFKDAEWLQAAAVRHESAIRLAERATAGRFLPTGFGSVFRDISTLQDLCTAHAEEIGEFFEFVDGSREWSLKCFAKLEQATDTELRARIADIQNEAGTAMADGRRYLIERSLRPEAEADARAALTESCDRLADVLEEYTLGVADRRPVGENAEGLPMLAHFALLIAERDRAEFDANLDDLAAELEADGIELELSGPWPAYSFAPRLGETEDDNDTVVADAA